MEYVRIVWRRYLSAEIDLTSTSTLEEQDALSCPNSPLTVAAMADAEIPAKPLLSSPTVPDDEEDYCMGVLVEVDGEERVGVKRRLRDLQKTCSVKM